MSNGYNSHAVQKIACRQKSLDQKLIIAMPIIKAKGTELTEGETLQGIIHWREGLVQMQQVHSHISDEELMRRQSPYDGPCYSFRYDGKKLELFIWFLTEKRTRPEFNSGRVHAFTHDLRGAQKPGIVQSLPKKAVFLHPTGIETMPKDVGHDMRETRCLESQKVVAKQRTQGL